MAKEEERVIRVNNRDEIEWEEGLTISALLEKLRYTYPHIIVSIDGQVVHREQYATQTIPDGAEVRVLHLSAGG